MTLSVDPPYLFEQGAFPEVERGAAGWSAEPGRRPPACGGVGLEAGPGRGAGPPCFALLGASPRSVPRGKNLRQE
ncbi:Ferm, Arhgef And Pleckstrin Domain-Containing Protein 2 [Manis pentadactyla]|nr:Ferm, Arhgef And Pleckstrin Domain-Containing Protein 2 [Manis pentadactyla]